MAIYDSITKHEIRLHMTKDEIDKILGISGEMDAAISYAYNYDGLMIYYRDNKTAAFIDLKDNSGSGKGRYSTVRGIRIGDKKGNMIKVYGDTIDSEIDIYSTDYFIENRNGTYVFLKYAESLDKDKLEKFEKDKTSIITFYHDENDSAEQRINRITIYDYKFGIELK